MPTTQKIFGLGRPTPGVSWDDIVPVMQTEAAHVWSLYEQDVMRDAWLRTDALGTVYVLEADPSQASRLLAAQPMAQHGLVDFEVVPVGPFTPLSLMFGTQPQPITAAARPAAGEHPSTRVLALDGQRNEVAIEDLAPHLADEATHAWSLWKAGIVRESYLRTDRAGVALVLEVAGQSEARAVLSDLPLVRAGLIDFEYMSLATFTGFDALFEGSLDDTPEPLADPTQNPDRSHCP